MGPELSSHLQYFIGWFPVQIKWPVSVSLGMSICLFHSCLSQIIFGQSAHPNSRTYLDAYGLIFVCVYFSTPVSGLSVDQPYKVNALLVTSLLLLQSVLLFILIV